MVAMPMTLFGALEPTVAPSAQFERTALDDTSWADVARDLLLGADSLFDSLVRELPFTQSRRLMYDRWVDEPRLSCGLELSDAPAVVRSLARAFTKTYGVEFDSCFVNYYRDGHDSVAWHSDRIGRTILDPHGRHRVARRPAPIRYATQGRRPRRALHPLFRRRDRDGRRLSASLRALRAQDGLRGAAAQPELPSSLTGFVEMKMPSARAVTTPSWLIVPCVKILRRSTRSIHDSSASGASIGVVRS